MTGVRPRRETLCRTIAQPGQIEGFEQTALYSKIAGFVRAYHFDIGDLVRKGQLLAELWVPEVVEDLRQKEATVVQDEAKIVQTRAALRVAAADMARAEANLRLAEASRTRAETSSVWWKVEYKRVSRLVAREAAPQEDREQTTEKLKTAEANVSETIAAVKAAHAALAESLAQRDKAGADVRGAEARMRVAHADRDRAAAILGYARIEAPFDGVVARRAADTGAYVQAPGGNATAATPLFEVVQTDLVRIFVDVPEADAAYVRDGGPAHVQVQALGDREFSGVVVRSGWLLDNRTRTLRTAIDLSKADGRLRPGMYATARIPVEHPDVLSLPASAVFCQDDQSCVVRIEGNKAFWIPVRLGVQQGERVEALRKQTHSAPHGEPSVWEDFIGAALIVRDNPSTLTDGQEVRSQPGEPALVTRFAHP